MRLLQIHRGEGKNDAIHSTKTAKSTRSCFPRHRVLNSSFVRLLLFQFSSLLRCLDSSPGRTLCLPEFHVVQSFTQALEH